MFRRSLFALLLVFQPLERGLCEPAIEPQTESRQKEISQIRVGLGLLDRKYWSPTLGIWLDQPGDDLRAHYEGRRNPPWWPSANAVELLIDFMNATGTAEHDAAIVQLYELRKDPEAKMARLVAELQRRQQWSEADSELLQARRRRAANRQKNALSAGAPVPAPYYTDFQNEYLDDSGWWALAWLKMAERTGQMRYQQTAQTIHAHMARNWRPDKDGGILWCEDEDKQRPNAITNSLFVILSARLYQRTHEPAYLQWAEKTLQWFKDRELFDGTAVIDGPGHQGDYWSYNQGTYLGALCALFTATQRREYLDQAVAAAQRILEHSGLRRPDGVLVEKLGTDGDATLFKGIFARYLRQLRDILQTPKRNPEVVALIERTLQSSVASMRQHGVGAEGFFTAEWHVEAKNRRTDFNTQVSGLCLLVAALPEGTR